MLKVRHNNVALSSTCFGAWNTPGDTDLIALSKAAGFNQMGDEGCSYSIPFDLCEGGSRIADIGIWQGTRRARFYCGSAFAGWIWRGLTLLTSASPTAHRAGPCENSDEEMGLSRRRPVVGGLRPRGATDDGPPALLPPTRRGLYG